MGPVDGYRRGPSVVGPKLGETLDRIRRTVKWDFRLPRDMSQQRDRRSGTDSAIRAVRLDDGGLIVYDTDNEDAWVQADEAVPFG